MNYYICALIVTIVSFLIFFKWKHKGIKGKEYLYFFLLISLPLSALVNIFIKAPIYSQLERILGINEDMAQGPIWYYPIVLIIGAGAEEIIKILPLLVIMRMVSLENANIYSSGMLLGIGFGIGEAWYLGYNFNQNIPEYSYGFKNFFLLLCGFGGERLFTVFIHGFLTACLSYGVLLKKPIRYFLIVVLIHSLINFPALLFQLQKISGEMSGILIVIIFCFFLFSVFLKIEDQLITKWEEPILQQGDELLYERKK